MDAPSFHRRYLVLCFLIFLAQLVVVKRGFTCLEVSKSNSKSICKLGNRLLIVGARVYNPVLGQKGMTQHIPLILETILQRFLRTRNITHIVEIVSTDCIFLSHATALNQPAMVNLKSGLVNKDTASHLTMGGSPSGLSPW